MSPKFIAKLYNHSLVFLFLCVYYLTYFSCHAKLLEIDNNSNNKGLECVEIERDALLEFKRGIRVDNCGFLDSWGVAQDCCLWSGIECHNNSGHVIALRLPTPYDYVPHSCLEGTISISLLNLTQLKYLDLSYNYFGGQIPKFIGSLSNLEHLDLSNAGFIGVIPHEIGNLTKLTSLNLSSYNYDYYDYYHSNMRVENLVWLSQLTLLREVNLRGIDLSIATNNWFSIVNNLPLLRDLRLDDCNLSLRMPSSLSYINSTTTLGVLSLSYNNLNDTSIFEWLSNLGGVKTSFVYLDLSFNDQVLKNNLQVSRATMNFLGSLCSLKNLIIPSTGLKYKFSDLIQSLSACSHKSLVFLGLDLNQLWGSIPDNLSNLSNLRRLVVSDNQLSGGISQAALTGLPMLESLRLSLNSLKGVINHDHLSNLSKLRYLNLDDNTELVVNISDNWVPPFQLYRLRLRSCKVGPNFPTWLLTQKNLTILEISNTSISDTIPISFFNSLSSKLELLSMSQNMMYGVLPNVSITFEASPWINLSSNNFSGKIPLYLRNVSVLHLNNNHFSEGLVPFLCPPTKMPLTYLDLSNNSFSDKLPDCWGYFDKLKDLHLENNNLWGNLPISFGSLNQLKALHLSSNNLSGGFLASLETCTSLVILDLAQNSLSGYIPSALGNIFKQLSILILRENNFFGTLPSSLCHLSQLQVLDFSNNKIYGTIPRCIYNLTGMVETESLLQTISHESPDNNTPFPGENAMIIWKGEKQAFQDDYLLGHVKAIDLSNNILEGQIPEGISSLVGLKQINLSRNHLSGAIMSRIGQLTSLESLDLSHNHLSGEIPLSLAKISYLEVLDLSYNNLSGRIPDGTQLQSFNSSSYIGNSGLCGAPLPKCDGDEVAKVPQNNVDGEHRDDKFMLGVYISVMLGFIIGFWGVCGTLVVKTSWRHAFFRFYDDIKDKIYVMVVGKRT